MLHGLTIPHVHLHHVVIELAPLNNSVLNHHDHFFLMRLMHIGRTNVEFMHQLPFVLNHKAHRFAWFDFDSFRLVVVVIHVHSNTAAGIRGFTWLATAGTVAVPTSVGTGAECC